MTAHITTTELVVSDRVSGDLTKPNIQLQFSLVTIECISHISANNSKVQRAEHLFNKNYSILL